MLRQGARKSRAVMAISAMAALRCSNDPDVYAILPYRADAGISAGDISCRTWLNKAGVHVWHERVRTSDGSLSNYVAINRPDIRYVNMEAKKGPDLSIAATAQGLMVDAYLAGCK